MTILRLNHYGKRVRVVALAHEGNVSLHTSVKLVRL
jgi:hypothetical protein